MAVIVPPGCRHIGWYCEHERVANPEDKYGIERTPHRSPNWGRARTKSARERGYDISTSTISSFDYRRDGDYRDSDCPDRKPVFVYEGTENAT